MGRTRAYLPAVPRFPINKETGPLCQGPGSPFPNTPQEGALSKITRATFSMILHYWSSCKTVLVLVLAWASIAVADCVRMAFLV